MTKDYGIKISKPGIDVKSATDKELVFSSKFDTFKVALSGTGSFTQTGSAQTDTIAHGLGYTPAFFVYSEIHAGFGEPSTGDFYMMPHSLPFGIGGDLLESGILVSSDSTNLNIRLGNNVVIATRVINYKYVIFHNKAEA